MSKTSGLTLETQKRRIVKRTPRPHVSVVPQPSAAPAAVQEEVATPSPIVSESFSSPVEQEQPVPARVEVAVEPVEVAAPESTKKAPRKASAKKKEEKKHWKDGTSGGHRLKRYEGRLHGDHAEIMEYLHDKGARQTHKQNREIKKPEMLAGLIELIRPFHKKVSFTNTNFERGQMYGEGADRLRSEVGRSFKKATYKYVIQQLLKGEDPLLEEAVLEMSDDERREILTQVSLLETHREEPLAANE